MNEHRYPLNAMAQDYTRAGLGLFVTLGPLLFLQTSPVMMWILMGLAALFLVFGARTVLRHMTVVRVDDQGIAAIGPMGVSITWNELGRLALAYYSTRRDRTRGWMQLSVQGRGRTLRVDSSIAGFRDIAAAAAGKADEMGLSLTPATIGNLASLGIDVRQPAEAQPRRA